MSRLLPEAQHPDISCKRRQKIAATVLMIIHAIKYSSPELKPYFVAGVSVFGAALIFTYLFSTIYHALVPLGAKKIFAILDRMK